MITISNRFFHHLITNEGLPKDDLIIQVNEHRVIWKTDGEVLEANSYEQCNRIGSEQIGFRCSERVERKNDGSIEGGMCYT